MITMTNITRQMLLASAFVMAGMAGAGEASAQTTLGMIVRAGFPYSASPQDIYNKPPLGQFAFNMHLCAKAEMPALDGLKVLEFILPSGEAVYSDHIFLITGAVARDPAGDKRCASNAAQSATQAQSMAASGAAPAQTTTDVTPKREATAPFFAVIAKAPVPYYRGKNFGVVGNTPPAGQFSSNQPLCATFKLTWKGREFVKIMLPGGGGVYAVYSTETFTPDPANNKRCLATFTQYALKQSASELAQSASTSAPYIPAPGQRATQPAPNYVTPSTASAGVGQSNSAKSTTQVQSASGATRQAEKSSSGGKTQTLSGRVSAALKGFFGGKPAVNAKSTAAGLSDPEEAQAAFSFLKRQMTISTSLLGDPEPGLGSIQSEEGTLCRLRCGFHLASEFGNGGVDDAEIEFALSDINIDTIRYDIDGIGRAIISFGTTDGSPRFWRRDREMDMKQKVLSEWSKWEGADKGFCRAQPDKESLERAMKALAYLAESCGAKESPF